MCERCEKNEERMLAIIERSDPAFTDGSRENSWLSWEPVISDRQLAVFADLLQVMREASEHGGNGPRAFALDEAANLAVPANVTLVLLRELQALRQLATAESLTAPDSVPENWTLDE